MKKDYKTFPLITLISCYLMSSILIGTIDITLWLDTEKLWSTVWTGLLIIMSLFIAALRNDDLG